MKFSRFLILTLNICFFIATSLSADLKFSNRCSAIAIQNSSSKLRLGNVNRVSGWSQESIIKDFGHDSPSNWVENYSDGVVIAQDGEINIPATNLVYSNSNAIVALDSQIRTIDHGPSDIIINSSDPVMTYDYFLSNDHILNIQNSCIFDGGGHFINFAKDNAGILSIADSSNVVLKNVVLKNFNDMAIQLGDSSTLIFGDGVTIELYDSQDLTKTWTFAGNSTINGFGNTLDFVNMRYLDSNVIQIMQGGNLTIENTTIEGLFDNNLRCVGNATITLKNDMLNTLHGPDIVDSIFSFTSGSLIFDQDVKLKGIFEYQTDQPSLIRRDSKLIIEPMFPGTIFFVPSPISMFIYNPIVANRDLIVMEDFSSELHLNGCVLASTTTGMRLTNGAVVVKDQNYIWGFGASTVEEAICFGSGDSPNNDVFVNILPGASLKILDGILDINTDINVN